MLDWCDRKTLGFYKFITLFKVIDSLIYDQVIDLGIGVQNAVHHLIHQLPYYLAPLLE